MLIHDLIDLLLCASEVGSDSIYALLFILFAIRHLTKALLYIIAKILLSIMAPIFVQIAFGLASLFLCAVFCAAMGANHLLLAFYISALVDASAFFDHAPFFPLMRLPSEIRAIIFGFAAEIDPIGGILPGVAHVSRQVRREYLAAHYAICPLLISVQFGCLRTIAARRLEIFGHDATPFAKYISLRICVVNTMAPRRDRFSTIMIRIALVFPFEASVYDNDRGRWGTVFGRWGRVSVAASEMESYGNPGPIVAGRNAQLASSITELVHEITQSHGAGSATYTTFEELKRVVVAVDYVAPVRAEALGDGWRVDVVEDGAADDFWCLRRR